MNSVPANLDGSQLVMADRQMRLLHLLCVEKCCHRSFVSATTRLGPLSLPENSSVSNNCRVICLTADLKAPVNLMSMSPLME